MLDLSNVHHTIIRYIIALFANHHSLLRPLLWVANVPCKFLLSLSFSCYLYLIVSFQASPLIDRRPIFILVSLFRLECLELTVPESNVLPQSYTFLNTNIYRRYSVIFRYSYGGSGLYISKPRSAVMIPPCPACGSERVFELQLMPALVTLLTHGNYPPLTLTVRKYPAIHTHYS